MSGYYHLSLKGKRYKVRKRSVIGFLYSHWDSSLFAIAIVALTLIAILAFLPGEVNPWCGV